MDKIRAQPSSGNGQLGLAISAATRHLLAPRVTRAVASAWPIIGWIESLATAAVGQVRAGFALGPTPDYPRIAGCIDAALTERLCPGGQVLGHVGYVAAHRQSEPAAAERLLAVVGTRPICTMARHTRAELDAFAPADDATRRRARGSGQAEEFKLSRSAGSQAHLERSGEWTPWRRRRSRTDWIDA